MAVRNWHGGQVVLYWAGLVLAYFISVTFANIYVAEVTDPVASYRLTSVLVVVFFVQFVLLLAGLVVTWRWFGARRGAKR